MESIGVCKKVNPNQWATESMLRPSIHHVRNDREIRKIGSDLANVLFYRYPKNKGVVGFKGLGGRLGT